MTCSTILSDMQFTEMALEKGSHGLFILVRNDAEILAAPKWMTTNPKIEAYISTIC
jgi:hypothetical protein